MYGSPLPLNPLSHFTPTDEARNFRLESLVVETCDQLVQRFLRATWV